MIIPPNCQYAVPQNGVLSPEHLNPVMPIFRTFLIIITYAQFLKIFILLFSRRKEKFKENRRCKK